MLLPIGDTPNPRCRPWATYGLIALNVAVFLLVTLPQSHARPDLNDPMLVEYLRSIGVHGPVPIPVLLQHVSAYDLTVFRWGFRPVAPSALTIFTAMFLHGGWLHLVGNMLFLYIFGDNVECRLGRSVYLLVYLGTGLCSTLFFSLFALGSPAPLIGASGAISGILGCYFLWFPRNRIKVFIFLFPFIITTILVPSRIVLGIFLVVENLLPFLFTSASSGGVAHGAHIGGFVAGVGVAWLANRVWGIQRYRRAAETAEFDGPDEADGAGRSVDQWLRRGEAAQAAAGYLALAGRNERLRVADTDALAVARYLRRQGRAAEAVSVLRRFVAERPRSPELGSALLVLGELMLADPRLRASAYQYFLAITDVSDDPDLLASARRHLRELEGER